MNGRARVRCIISGQPADRCGLWLGDPREETWRLLHAYFGTREEEEVRRALGDDFRWICPQWFPDLYRDPNKSGIFELGPGGGALGRGDAPLAGCEDVGEIDDYPWPDPNELHFDSCLKALREAGDVYRASGFWTPFFHDMIDLLGMEEYLVKMHTHPELIHAITDRVCGFYLKANERFFAAAGEEVDGSFVGNDFGTQLDLICGPSQFDEFIMPWLRRFVEQAHAHGHHALIHSCGAIHKVIDRLIDAGVDCLHPLQALADGMDAETLARDFKGRIAFMGGVDTQDLLINGTPDDVKAEVRRLTRLLGPCFVVSSSHEAVLPNVPPENLEAMAIAAVRTDE